ncbi:MAG: hypothetical protein V7704_02885 [Aurantimonas endophytica]|uniref:hypothetical protein n=1 Tax=Aurantimonas endophytica TaxID=1522175 RepID=UPI003001892C
MTRLLATSVAALVLFGSTMASAQYVPGSNATSRANGYAERLKVATGYPEAAGRSPARASTFGFPEAGRQNADIPGSDYARKRADEAARASVQRRVGVTGF